MPNEQELGTILASELSSTTAVSALVPFSVGFNYPTDSDIDEEYDDPIEYVKWRYINSAKQSG
ncbi:MAG: hypothetical protein ABIF08_01420 [Nanoarchaeota archaeon]